MSKKINVLYRLSDNGYLKTKFDFATKQACLRNASLRFPFNFHLFVDTTNLQESTKNIVEEYAVDFESVQYYIGGSSAASWNHVFNYALNSLNSSDIVYFLEDDYIHRPHSQLALLEGIEFGFDYVSLYDHRDKYIPANKGGNPLIDSDGGEVTKVFLTESTHWKLTNSTTMTFATTIQTLQEDADIWKHYTLGTHPNDMMCFLELRKKGRTLATPIPGYSTHCEPAWSAPLINWETVI